MARKTWSRSSGSINRVLPVLLLILAAVLGVAVCHGPAVRKGVPPASDEIPVPPAPSAARAAHVRPGFATPRVEMPPESDVPNVPADDSNTPEDALQSTVAERIVWRFNAKTDQLVRQREISVADIQDFGNQLKEVPQDRRLECLHRALNLIPDRLVALLAGVVMDKTQDRAVVETAFHDVVNRPEEVKKPILDEIVKDKTHPCYSDAEWIYEVTGEKPSGDGN